MLRTYCFSYIYSISCHNVHFPSPDFAFLLYFLIWRRKFCLFWCSVYSFHIYFLMWRTSCIFWCGIFPVCPDVACNISSLLMWRINCSSDTYDISWYRIRLVSPDVAYSLNFRCGVQCSVPLYIAFILYLLVWHSCYITWCTLCPLIPHTYSSITLCVVQYIVSPDMAYILFFTYIYIVFLEVVYLLYVAYFFVILSVAYITLCLLMWHI